MTVRILGALLLAAALSACGQEAGRDTAPRAQPSSGSAPGDTLYEAVGLVLESRDGDVGLCLGGVMESLPPQCEGIPLEGWDWDAVSGEETAAGVTWGDFRVTGYYDGETFTLDGAGPIPSPEPPPEEDRYATPCTEPPDGWEVTDPERMSVEDTGRVSESLVDDPEHAALWVDRTGGSVILNAAFTGSLDRHEAEIRKLWGGPLCMIERGRSHKELAAIQRELSNDPRVEVLWSDIDQVKGQVLLSVVAMDDAMRVELEERYGAGAVKVMESLHPVE